jgi:hypothetical protein
VKRQTGRPAEQLLAYMKARGCASDYLSTAVAILDEVAAYVTTIRTNMQRQRSWYHEQLASCKLRPRVQNVVEYDYGAVWGGVAKQCEVAIASSGEPSQDL